MAKPRNSVKALIVRDGHVLLLRKQEKGKSADESYYVFPGGGQDFGETLEEALDRECREEIGAGVEVGALLSLREYRNWKHGFGSKKKRHQLEFLFSCSVADDYVPQLGPAPDSCQVATEWIAIEELGEYPLFPKIWTEIIRKNGNGKVSSGEEIYLGDVN